MEMNIIKTKAMEINKTTPTPKINITFDGKPVQQTDKMISVTDMKIQGFHVVLAICAI